MAKAATVPASGPWTDEQMIAFIRCWNKSSTIGEVAKEMKLTNSLVYRKARLCKKAGVNLKDLGRATAFDWSAIKAALAPAAVDAP